MDGEEIKCRLVNINDPYCDNWSGYWYVSRFNSITWPKNLSWTTIAKTWLYICLTPRKVLNVHEFSYTISSRHEMYEIRLIYHHQFWLNVSYLNKLAFLFLFQKRFVLTLFTTTTTIGDIRWSITSMGHCE